jgi:hypothetical protein
MDLDRLKANEEFQAAAFDVGLFALMIAWSMTISGLLE